MGTPSPVRRRVALGGVPALIALPWRQGLAAGEDALQVLLPFPPIGAPEYIGALPASRAQRGLQAASPVGPADALARIVARAVEVATGRAVRVARLPGGRGDRACAQAWRDPRLAVLASEALCVHDALASPALLSAVDRLEPCAAVAITPYRRLGSSQDTEQGSCTIAHAGHGGRGASIAARLVAADGRCRDVAFAGGQAALRALAAGQSTQAVLPWPLARAALAGGRMRDLGPAGPPGWFALLAAPGSPYASGSAAIALALAELASAAVLGRLGLEPASGPAQAIRGRMLHERQTLRLSSLVTITDPRAGRI